MTHSPDGEQIRDAVLIMMKVYKVITKPSVEKDFRSLPKTTLTKILSAIKNLSEDLFPGRVAKLEGTERTYRIRVGDYRIV